ncbi:uncharacterized protein LAESUDRAFT_120444 [Laetiporus sulphureus 93-53]|uniref:Uncharacterized protein n=1 Tax=Laetiporus sulphureus 93-53 TaxID=1314785 RepID=A0A165EKC4_9APHY|nr:uncharacterized protein LAESUDRAFT_120444 [Laetiporus sulphureus 93-53]KZT07237.1 hypothetical protein LAESUDRAFT_120444 [Laetiporus sulphureus 93-53]
MTNWNYHAQDPKVAVLNLDGCYPSLSSPLIMWLLATLTRQSLRTLLLRGDIHFSVLAKGFIVLSCRSACFRVQYTREQRGDGSHLFPEVPGESLVTANIHLALRDPPAQQSPLSHCCNLENPIASRTAGLPMPTYVAHGPRYP